MTGHFYHVPTFSTVSQIDSAIWETQFKGGWINFFWANAATQTVFFYNPLSFCQIFLPLISAMIGFHDKGLVTAWAQLLITSNYYLPSSSKEAQALIYFLRLYTCHHRKMLQNNNFGDKFLEKLFEQTTSWTVILTLLYEKRNLVYSDSPTWKATIWCNKNKKNILSCVNLSRPGKPFNWGITNSLAQ